MPVSGPDFISLQVRDLSRSADFYEKHLGLTRRPGPPHAVVFDTAPVAFAVRDPLPGVDLDAVTQPGHGIALWMHASDTREIYAALVEAGVPVMSEPSEGPFGLTFTFADPDGYHITLHDRT